MAALKEDIDETEDYINSIVSYALPKHVSKQKILEATLIDPVLIKLSEAIRTNKIDKNAKDIQSFSRVFNELTVTTEGLILRDSRLVIPMSLQNEIIQIAHEGHLGITKTKQLLRSKVWFPNIDVQVETMLKQCIACRATDVKTHTAPINMSPMPSAPWEEISIDLKGPIKPNDEHLMVVIDDYSRFPLLETLTSITAATIIKRLDTIFSIFGVPNYVRTDNGPAFRSKEFEDFSKHMGFIHIKVTPLWPQANGLVESFMKNLGKVIKTAFIDKISWKIRLTEFLRNYRSTPHATTNIAPINLFLRNGDTSRLPKYKHSFIPTLIDIEARTQDNLKKSIKKSNAEIRKKPKTINFKIGDTVLVKQDVKNKSMSKYDPIPYNITYINHSLITASREDKTITRNISFFKHIVNTKYENKKKTTFNEPHELKEKVKPKGIRFYFKKGGENINEDNNSKNSSETNENENLNISLSDQASDHSNYLNSDEEQTIVEITKSEAEELDELNNQSSVKPTRVEPQLFHTSSDPEILHGQNTERILRSRVQKDYTYKRKYTKRK